MIRHQDYDSKDQVTTCRAMNLHNVCQPFWKKVAIEVKGHRAM